jgi:hypothetical protein
MVESNKVVIYLCSLCSGFLVTLDILWTSLYPVDIYTYILFALAHVRRKREQNCCFRALKGISCGMFGYRPTMGMAYDPMNPFDTDPNKVMRSCI